MLQEKLLNQNETEEVEMETLGFPMSTISTNDSLKLLLKDVSKYPLLTSEEEIDLAVKTNNGNKSARELFINSNLRLVLFIAKRYLNRGLDILDLFSEGVVGLMHAVDLFDPALGYKFSTYATPWISQAIDRAVAYQGKSVNIPIRIVNQINKVNKARNEFYVTNGKDASDKEISDILGEEFTVDYIKDLDVYARSAYQDSLDREIVEDGASLGEIVTDIDNEVTENINTSDKKRLVNKALSILDERHKYVLIKCFGLDGKEPETLEEIGQDLNHISKERVRQLRDAGIKTLRNSQYFSVLQSCL